MRASALFTFLLAAVASPAQLTVCTLGGSGDGYGSGCGRSLGTGLTRMGGGGDGYGAACTPSMASNIAHGGGPGDGHAFTCGATRANNAVFAGAVGDGYVTGCGSTPASNAVFTGGTGDGHDVRCARTMNTNLSFAGGTDDGWASSTDVVRFSALRAIVLLEGPYDANMGLMRDDLRAHGLLPLSEPYTAIGLPPSVGDASNTSTAVLAEEGNDAIVDWIAMELRSANARTTTVARAIGLVQRDGDVVGVDGTGPLVFRVPEGEYYLAVRHRNHLGVITAAPVSIGCAAIPVDLTNASALFGVEASKPINGVEVLWAGDVTTDGQVKYTGALNDRDPILLRIGGVVPTNTVVGYFREDVNMDGVVKYTGAANDRDPILVNIGGAVPTNVRNAQLP